MNIRYALIFISLLVGEYTYSQNYSLEVRPVFNGDSLKKNTWYLSKSGDSLQFVNVKFYITDFKFQLANNIDQEILNSSYLVDAFNESTLSRSLDISQSLAIEKVCFSLGVRGDLSEAGALQGDLDPVNGMYWAWQSGYINMKIEGVSPSCPTRKNRFTFHIGGYKEPYETLRELTFPINKKTKTIVVEVDVAEFMDEVNLKIQHSLMIPEREAALLADKSIKMFEVK